MVEEALRLETPGVITVESLEKSDWTKGINNILPSTITLTKQRKVGGCTGLLPVIQPLVWGGALILSLERRSLTFRVIPVASTKLPSHDVN